MQADFWRYAVIYQYGGIYLDIDIEPLKPIKEWKHYPFDKLQVLIGLENGFHLCQWGFIAAPRQPLFAEILRVIRDKWEHERNNTEFPEYYEHFVHGYSGPGIFTNAINNFLELDPDTHSDKILEFYRNESSPVR